MSKWQSSYRNRTMMILPGLLNKPGFILPRSSLNLFQERFVLEATVFFILVKELWGL